MIVGSFMTFHRDFSLLVVGRMQALQKTQEIMYRIVCSGLCATGLALCAIVLDRSLRAETARIRMYHLIASPDSP